MKALLGRVWAWLLIAFVLSSHFVRTLWRTPEHIFAVRTKAERAAESQTLVVLQNQPIEEVVVDSYLDLTRERLEGERLREENRIVVHPVVHETPQPVYRRDGQVHNFNAVPMPGINPKRNLTVARYKARYLDERPRPVRGAHDNNTE